MDGKKPNTHDMVDSYVRCKMTTGEHNYNNAPKNSLQKSSSGYYGSKLSGYDNAPKNSSQKSGGSDLGLVISLIITIAVSYGIAKLDLGIVGWLVLVALAIGGLIAVEKWEKKKDENNHTDE